ncbi:hypothetical protein F5Y13DRAFT_200081 [Hypoxylon sp. FL1857]|nr:hypothetical protein F5Y13DRAFT_200081 [Hypoxylon sp. FL1857]
MASPSSRPSGSSEPGEIDDTDSISITSTNHDEDADQEKEWVVDDILAERDHPDMPGEKQYLIKWENFPMDQCTWEPAENLGPGLLSEWTETKEEIEAGRRQPFDVEIFNAAYRERYARHERRNVKRIRLGISPTYLPSPDPHILEDSASVASRDDPSFDDGAQETDDIDPGRLPPMTKPRDVVKQKTPPSVSLETPREEVSGTPNVKKKKPKKPPTPVLPSKSAQRPAEPKRVASNDGIASKTKTGYQGTARKPSIGMKYKSSSSTAPSSKGVDQKATTSTSKTSSAIPPRMTSSLANKFAGKRLTATRTRPQPVAPPMRTSNVFVSGKERKKRASLGDIMDDPSKAPKAFNSMRVMNIAKKRGIEKKDVAHPDISSIPASFILNSDRNSCPNVDKTKANAPSAPPEPPPLVQSPTAISPISTSAPTLAPKARKSVRFTGAEDIPLEDVPMVDAPSNVAEHTDVGPGGVDHSSGGSESIKTSPPARRLSLASYQERGQTQVVSRIAVFGKAGSESIRVLFTDIARQSQPWLTAFIAQEKLNFDSICASYNFMSHKASLVGEILSAGAIEAASDEIKSTLTNIAEHLRRGSYGCHLVTEHFSILVYPSQCDGWDGLGPENNMSTSPLRHMIYRSSNDIRLYPPMTVPRAPTRLRETEQVSPCRVLVKDLCGLDFTQFLPQAPSEKDRQVFMLIFPEREAQVCNMIKLWLRSCQPNCRIFSQELKDSWAKFHETVRATNAAGTVILHEDVSAAIRRLPRVFQLLDNKLCYTFWDLATGQYNPPRFPSDSISATIEPGTLQMTRLFPHGRAFLITPSFVLSDPVKLCQFLDWFRHYCVNPHYLIMACADFPSYLKAITLEKEKERGAMCSSHKDDPKLEEMLADYGLSKSDLDARFRAWKILKDIMEKFGDEETSEEIRKVSWITNLIDPNDEQSLVNWFCWWSTLKCDQYRKFTVLGSSNSKIRAAYRNIEIPAYTNETVGDPDIALAREDQRRHLREAEATEDIKRTNQEASTIPGYANTGSTPTIPISRPSSNFKSRIFRSDSAAELHQWIIAQFDRFKSGLRWARLHGNPVSWLNVAMADYFGDPRCGYDTFKNWIGNSPDLSRSVNTWYGLFYTIDKEWNPQEPPHTYGRHPWIAVIRPFNPHLKPYSKMELFIWDLSARDRKHTNGNTALLLSMQRHLIEVVKRELPLKDERFSLDVVYTSSTTNVRPKPDDNPLDVTCWRLREMLNDGKTWLPPFQNLLFERGWSPLADSEWRGSIVKETPDIPAPAQHQSAFPRHYSDEGKPQRSIWHAPRGKKGGKSRCGNHLYEAALHARMKNESCQKMKYQYKSILDWYHDMKVEGRDASHVNVDSADKIIDKLIHRKR